MDDQTDRTGFPKASDLVNTSILHPLYIKYASIWEILRRCYMGGYEFRPILSTETENKTYRPELISFLRKHTKETTESFIQRHNSSYYVNKLKTIYDRFSMYIFGAKSEIQRSWEPNGASIDDYFNRYIYNMDGAGNSINDYMETIFRNVLNYGLVYSLVDHSYVDKSLVRTELQKQRTIQETWCNIIYPWQVINWKEDVNGNLEFVVIRTDEVTSKNAVSAYETVTTYYYYDNEIVARLDDKNEYMEGYPRYHDFGGIPIIKCTLWDFNHDGIPEPFSQDIADLAIERYNNDSSIIEELDNATFPMLQVPGNPNTEMASEKRQELMKQDDLIVIGNRRCIRLNPDTTLKAEYITYPTNTLDFKLKRSQDLDDQMEALAHEKASQIADSVGVISGYAIHQQQSKKFMFIALMAKRLEDIEYKHWDMILYWDYPNDATKPVITLDYPTKYDAYDAQQARDNFINTVNVVPSVTYKVQISMNFIREVMPYLEDADYKKMQDELSIYYEANQQSEISRASRFNTLLEGETEEEEEGMSLEGNT